MDELMGERQDQMPLFRVWMCGPFRVEQRIDGAYVPLPTTAWGGYQVTRQLLKVLLCAPQRQARREALLERLWPDEPFSQATLNLNTATGKLRKALHPLGGSESLLGTQDDGRLYQLAGQSQLWVDVDEALALLAEVEQLGRHTPAALPLLERALTSLNRGTLLEEEEGAWAAGRRATILRTRYRACFWLVESSVEQGCLGRAETLLNTLLEEDPTDEDALSRLMMVLHQQGMTHQALRLYEQACAVFADEGLEMPEGTHVFLAQLRDQRASSPFPIGSRMQKHFSLGQQHDAFLHGSIDPSPPKNPSTPPPFAIIDNQINASSLEKNENMFTLPSQYTALYDKLQKENGSERRENEDMDPLRRTTIAGLLSFFTEKALPLEWWDERAPARLFPLNRETFQYFQQLLEHGWELCNAGEWDIAERILESFLPDTIIYAPKQQEAALLASKGLILQSILHAHRLKLTSMVPLCKQAVFYARDTGDHTAICASLNGLAVAFKYTQQLEASFQTYREALEYCDTQASPLVQSRLYAGAAAAFARHKYRQEAEQCIQRAYDLFPEHLERDSYSLSADHGQYMNIYYHGLMHLALDQPKEALKVFERCQDIPRHLIPQRNFLEMINHQGRAALLSHELEMYAILLKYGVAGALKIKSKKRLEEVVNIFQEDLPSSWRSSRQIKPIIEQYPLLLQERQ